MCGIFGYVTDKETELGPILIEAAERLTYRGYDSVGAATLNNGKIDLRKDTGKVDSVAAKYNIADMRGQRGITQLRWATFGEPSQVNSQPHLDSDGDMVGAHNGNVVNNVELREQFIAEGMTVRSQNDGETCVHAVERYINRGYEFIDAIRLAYGDLEGDYAFVIGRANDDPAIGAIVMTGAGRGFCAGADMQDTFKTRIDGKDPGNNTAEGHGGMPKDVDWVRLCRESKPIVAAVNGAAVGIGVTMILPCDVIVASEKAKFGMFFIKMGLEDLPPFTFAGIRFVIAATVLFCIAFARRSRMPDSAGEWGYLALTGLLAFTINYGAVFWGEQHVSSGLAAVLQTTIPAFGLLIAHFHLPGERITAGKCSTPPYRGGDGGIGGGAGYFVSSSLMNTGAA